MERLTGLFARVLGFAALAAVAIGIFFLVGAMQAPQSRAGPGLALAPTSTVPSLSGTQVPPWTATPIVALPTLPPGATPPKTAPPSPSATPYPTRTPTAVVVPAVSRSVTVSLPAADFDRAYPVGSVVLSAPWGSQEGQFGRGPSRAGPASFAIDDEGAVYVLDTVNHRVQAFSRDGKYLAAYPVPESVGDIEYDAGSFYLLDGYGTHTVGKYDRSFRRLQEFPIAPEINLILSGGGLSAHAGSIFVGSLGPETDPFVYYYQIARQDTPIPVAEQPNRRVPGLPQRFGTGYLSVSKGADRSAIIRLHDAVGAIPIETRVHFDSPASPGFGKYLHQDRPGNVYLGVSFLLPGPTRFEGGVYKDYRRLTIVISPDGRLVRAADMTASGTASDVGKDTVIGPGGEIYQLRTWPRGVEVVRW